MIFISNTTKVKEIERLGSFVKRYLKRYRIHNLEGIWAHFALFF